MSRTRVALLACTNVIGGHEFQAAALGRSLMAHVELTVFINREEHAAMFRDAGVEVRMATGLLLEPGSLPRQCIAGWRRRKQVRELLEGFDHVIVSAGAVEAGIAAGVALKGHKPTSMYLPSFCDRVPMWGWKGHLYNCILSLTCRLFDRIITINKIQAYIISSFTGRPTAVVRNLVRPVSRPTVSGPPRLIYIGRLDAQKRLGELLRWLDFKDTPYQSMLIVGDGPLRAPLEDQAGRLQYMHCIFHGWMNAAAQDALFGSNDILILNSVIEGEPLVIREAQLRGMKVVARDIPGVRGITRKTRRFSTQEDLARCLQQMVATAAPQEQDVRRTADRRGSQILALLKILKFRSE